VKIITQILNIIGTIKMIHIILHYMINIGITYIFMLKVFLQGHLLLLHQDHFQKI